MRETAAILPFIQPAWKVSRVTDIPDGDVVQIAREYRSLLSKAPYKCAGMDDKDPTGTLELLGPGVSMIAYLQIYRHGAFCTTRPLAMSAIRVDLEMQGVKHECVEFIMGMCSYLSLRGYELRSPQVYVSRPARAKSGEIRFCWTPTKGGFEHVYVTVRLEELLTREPVKKEDNPFYNSSPMTPPFNLS